LLLAIKKRDVQNIKLVGISIQKNIVGIKIVNIIASTIMLLRRKITENENNILPVIIAINQTIGKIKKRSKEIISVTYKATTQKNKRQNDLHM
jgi:hypothetical protein